MGWYTVTKKIKGRAYLYKQQTYRDGQKVRTLSVYIGAVTDSAAAPVTPNLPTKSSLGKKPEIVAKTGLPPIDLPTGQDERILQELYADPKTKRRKYLNERVQPKSDTVIIQKPVEGLKLSIMTLHAEEKRVKNRMAKMGLPIETLKPMIVGVTSTINRRKSSKGYFVTAQKGGGRRTEFKSEYRRGLSERWLDYYCEKSPSEFTHLRADLDASYRNTRTALTQYILKGKMTNRRLLTLQMTWSKKLPKWLREHVKPEHLGLVDHERMGSWKEEAIHITAEMIRLGPSRSSTKYSRNAAIAKRASNREWAVFQSMGLMAKVTGKRRRQYRKCKQADARVKATAEMSRKVTILKSHLFKGK